VQRQSRRIIVMRHSRAEAAGPTDAERELTDGGRADAADAGRWLAGQGERPEHALVSAATRTRQTWEAVAGAAGWSTAPEYDQGLYTGGPDTVLDLVRAVPDAAASLFLLGHNPTVGHLAQLLDDGEADADLATAALVGGYPTSALSVFAFAGPWSDLDTGTARLIGFHVGRG
jgi:phosphohistidine phosphatase